MKRLFSKTVLPILLAVSCILSCLPFGALAITYPCDGEVIKEAQIWSLPGTTGHEIQENLNQSQYITTLSVGTKVLILGEELDGDGDKWFKIKYGDSLGKEGYIFNTRVKIIVEYVNDPEFEDWLNTQGFPESYKPGLRYLHTLYPNWKFFADKTKLNFDDAVSNLSGVGKKLISASRDDSYKSMASGAYDWGTDDSSPKYIGFDGDGWVTATDRTVAYYLDPRNFLDTTNVFMFLAEGYKQEENEAENVANAVKGTFMDANLPDYVPPAEATEENQTKTYAEVILEAAKESGVSPYAIIATIRQEQGVNGIGLCISGTYAGYEGLYNFFNIGAYKDKDGVFPSAIDRGLWWAKGASTGATTYLRPWTTREASIKGGALYYGENYIKMGQQTLYYKDFNVYGSGYALYTHQYATNIEDAKGKASGLAAAYGFIEDKELSFHIPIYENMPESTTLAPIGTNNNCYLTSLSVTDHTLNTFDRYTNSYELVVKSEVSEINVVAEKSDQNATVTGDGKVKLEYGNNTINIKVTASSGLENTYTLSVYREEGEVIVPEPTLDTPYKAEEIITGIDPDTNLTTFISRLGVKNGKVEILDGKGNPKTDGNIATGDTVYVYDLNNEKKMQFTVTIYGDINGDGRVTSVDLLVGQRHILKMQALTGAYLEAADTDHDYKIKSVDLLVGQRHILKIKSIVQ